MPIALCAQDKGHRPMLIATAGHIDHGKTTLVGALTGVATDRLPEEKARGLSIDLGFAYLPLGDGTTLGFVDVPGHERFIRNMLAGVGAVDLALVIVAADDGIMPQTREHIEIISLLDIPAAMVVITKADRVDAARIAAVSADIGQLMARTSLRVVGQHVVSAVTGTGIASLLAALKIEAAAPNARHLSAHIPLQDCSLRFWVDRSFSVAGRGTVVTGTLVQGRLALDQTLALAADGRKLRLRGLQSAGKTITEATPGMRCALNLPHSTCDEIKRGDLLVTPDYHGAATRVAVSLHILAHASQPVKHNMAVHFHIGTTSQQARVLLPDMAVLPAGQTAFAQVALQAPLTLQNGERFVIRCAAGRSTLGGGHVIDPLAQGARKSSALRRQIWSAMQQRDPALALKALLAIPAHEVDARHFCRSYGLLPETLGPLVQAAQAQIIGKAHPKILPRARITALREHILEALAAWHCAYPASHGMPVRDLDLALDSPVSASVRQSVQRDMAARREIVSAGSYLRLPHHLPERDDPDIALWNLMLQTIDKPMIRDITLADLARETNIPQKTLADLIWRMRGQGTLHHIGAERYMTSAALLRCAALAQGLQSDHPDGFTIATFRDVTGIGRNLAVRVMDFFDSCGMSHREDGRRLLRADHAAILRRHGELGRHISRAPVTSLRKPPPRMGSHR